MTRDVPSAAQEIWSGRLTAKAYLRSVADTSAFAIFSTDDPIPALLEIPLLFVAIVNGMRSRFDLTALLAKGARHVSGLTTIDRIERR
jgi:predicted ATP-grasp superfamily ATP-dependent carboligase